MAAKRLRLAHPAGTGTGHERLPAAPGAPSSLPAAPATVLVVNTLTSKPGEAPRDFLLRSGLDDGPLRKMPQSLFAEFGVAHAELRSRFRRRLCLVAARGPRGDAVALRVRPGFRTLEGLSLIHI